MTNKEIQTVSLMTVNSNFPYGQGKDRKRNKLDKDCKGFWFAFKAC
jgi:hypothetical protein